MVGAVHSRSQERRPIAFCVPVLIGCILGSGCGSTRPQAPATEVLLPLFRAGIAVEAETNPYHLSRSELAAAFKSVKIELDVVELTTKSRSDITPYLVEYRKAVQIFEASDILDRALKQLDRDPSLTKAGIALAAANLKDAGIDLDIQTISPSVLSQKSISALVAANKKVRELGKR